MVHRDQCSCPGYLFVCGFSETGLFMDILKLTHTLISIEPVLEANLMVFFVQVEASTFYSGFKACLKLLRLWWRYENFIVLEKTSCSLEETGFRIYFSLEVS